MKNPAMDNREEGESFIKHHGVPEANNPQSNAMMNKVREALFQHAKSNLGDPLPADITTRIEAFFGRNSLRFHTPDHPPYSEMIICALKALNEGEGSSEEVISAFIKSKWSDLPLAHSKLLSIHLGKLITKREIVSDSSGRFLLRRTKFHPTDKKVEEEGGRKVPVKKPGRPPKAKGKRGRPPKANRKILGDVIMGESSSSERRERGKKVGSGEISATEDQPGLSQSKGMIEAGEIQEVQMGSNPNPTGDSCSEMLSIVTKLGALGLQEKDACLETKHRDGEENESKGTEKIELPWWEGRRPKAGSLRLDEAVANEEDDSDYDYKVEEEWEEKEEQEEVESVKKRRRGRPSKARNLRLEGAVANEEDDSDDDYKVEEDQENEEEKEEEEEKPAKKKQPGRKSKAESLGLEGEEDEPVKKKRPGRPPKKQKETTAKVVIMGPKRPRGRPPKYRKQDD